MPVLRQALFCTRQLGKDREIHSLILTVAATLPIRFPNRIANDEIWRWFALLAVLVLALEWVVYHRRI